MNNRAQVGYCNQSCRSCGLYFCYLYFICIHVYFMDFFILQMGYWLQRQTRIWWNTFTNKGKRHRYSTLAQLLYSVWQQQPTANPGTGHRVKRSRQDDETQYQYRKRKVEQERLQTPEETQQPDVRVEKALCVKSVMKKIMQLTKEDLKSQLNDKKTSLDELSKHQQMDTRTIENMRLSLLILLSNIKCSAKIVM